VLASPQSAGVPLPHKASPQAQAAGNREAGTMASISRLTLSPW
jgi:hypothetical protein